MVHPLAVIDWRSNHMGIYPLQHKHCNKCGITKSIDNFGKDNKSKNGYISRCKQCLKEYKILNKERIQTQQHEYRLRTKDKKTAYDLAHASIKKIYNKEYRIANQEQIKQYNKEYKSTNKEKLNNQKKIYNKQKIDSS